MGSGYHGGFGATRGSGRSLSYKRGSMIGAHQNHSREGLISFIDGVTEESSAIARAIRNGSIRINVLGDKLFEDYLGVKHDTVALAIGNQIYLRNSSISIHSDMIHEGTHALDYIRGTKESEIASWTGEIRAYSAERRFQIAKGLHVDFANEDDMKVHIWKNYKRR